MRLKGEGDYFTGILLFLLFSGLLEMPEKVSVCLATHFLSFFFFCVGSCQEAHSTATALALLLLNTPSAVVMDLIILLFKIMSNKKTPQKHLNELISVMNLRLHQIQINTCPLGAY